MLSYLFDLENYCGQFHLIIRAVCAIVVSMILGFFTAPRLFAKLRVLKAKQSLRTKEQVGALAELHASKSQTPTMGGLMICVCVLVSVLLCARLNIYVCVSLLVYLVLTLIGFFDDYLKVVKKNSAGLPGRVKLVGQAGLTGAVLALLLICPMSAESMRELWFPFYGEVLWSHTPLLFLVPFLFLILAGSSNAVNLTDGVDGLAIGCVVTTVLALAFMAYFTGDRALAEQLSISYVSGAGELTVVCSAVLGASLVFLWYNAHPAEVFMGDTGSLALGGLIGILAFMIHQPFTLIIIGGVFVMEAVSVILQVGSYKLRKKRIFKMSPIHHHFELKGWPETKVVIRFWILSLIFSIAGLTTLIIG